MYLLSSSEIKNAEQNTIEKNKITMVSLMDKAASLFANWVDKKLLKDNMKIAVICGWGNNGGDGLTVARILHERGEIVHVYLLETSKRSKLCEQALSRYNGDLTTVKTVADLENLSSYHLVIDGILGIGVNRAFSEEILKIVRYINKHSKHIMAIDIPSGMLPEGTTSHESIEAQETMTFTCPKLSFFSSTNESRVGKWIVRNIDLVEFRPTKSRLLLTKELVKNKLKVRRKFTHKGSYGHALMVGGEKGNEHISLYNQSLDRFDVIGIGPGLGQSGQTIDAFSEFLRNYDRTLVLDADALNIIARMQLIDSLIPGSILTPHPGEFDRLFGEHQTDLDRLETQVSESLKRKVFIVLKDAYTTISTPEGDLYYSTLGNPGMATGGSGDVLTGIITGLLAQNHTLEDACLLGVYLHGYAGDVAAKSIGEMSMLSSDIITYLHASVRALMI